MKGPRVTTPNLDPDPILLVQNRVLAAERLTLCRAVMGSVVEELRASRLKVRVPRRRGLRERRAGMPFHPVPELFFQRRGATRFTLPEERFTLEAGEVCLMPRGMPHGERVLGAPGDFLTLVCTFREDGVMFIFGAGAAERTVWAVSFERVETPASAHLARLVDEVCGLCDEGSPFEDAEVQGLLTALFARLERELARPVATPTRAGNPLAARCRDLIDLHHAEAGLSLEGLARRLGCTPDHLSRVFRRQEGLSVPEAIHAARIRRARRFLEEPLGRPMTVGEIAAACGYASQSHFTRVFRAHTGLPPRRWRRLAR